MYYISNEMQLRFGLMPPPKKAIKLWDFALYQYATKCNIAIYATDEYQIL
jgi:hypothetical protein